MMVSFHKTLLAIAITSAALPAYAVTLSLSNSGLVEEDKIFIESVEVNGSFSGTNGDDAMEFNSVTFEKNLTLNTTVNSSGTNSGGLDLSVSGDDEFPESMGEPTVIRGDLVNKGALTVQGDGTSAMLIDPAIIHGSLINEGTLSAIGGAFENESVRGLEFSGQSEIYKDFINAASGKIFAEGPDAKGILIEGGEISGKLINRGLIEVKGSDSEAIDVTSGEYEFMGGYWSQPALVGGIENHGTIRAIGGNAEGIEIDGGQIGLAGIRNTGTIKADGTALRLEEFALAQDAIDAQEHYLKIYQEAGLIEGGFAAIDGRDEDGQANNIDLLWSGGTIRGNILGIGGYIEVSGNVKFDGTRIETNEWIDVGSISGEDNDGEPFVGHLELVQAHTTVDGNLYVAGNSSLGLNLSSATDATRAVLDVNGIAEFGNGSQIKLSAKGSDFSAEGTTYKLIEAESLENGGLSVVSSSTLLNVDTYTVEGNQVISKVTAKTAEDVAEVIQQAGGSGNARIAGSTFYNDVFRTLAASGSSDPVVQAFVTASSNPEALKKLSEQLAPETNGGATQAALSGQGLISNVTSGRSGAARGMSSGDHFQQAGVWVQSLYSDATQDLRDGVAGYNAHSRGIAVGADGKFNDSATLGLAYSFLNTDVNSDGGNNTEVDGHAFTLYGGYELGSYFVDGSLTYGTSDNASKRYIAGTTAKGDYDSDLLGLNLVGGYGIRLDSGLLIEPRVAARYSNVKIDSFSEQGSAAALKSEGQRYEVAELGTGLRLAGSFPAGQGTFEPQAKLMAYHDFAADRASSTSTFVLGNTPFVTSGAKPVRDSYEAGVGMDYHLGAVTLGVSYDYLGKSGFSADTVQAKLRYDF